MSFSVSFSAPPAEVSAKVVGQYNVPPEVAEFIVAAANALKDEQALSVTAYGHFYEPGSGKECTATIIVKPVSIGGHSG